MTYNGNRRPNKTKAVKYYADSLFCNKVKPGVKIALLNMEEEE